MLGDQSYRYLTVDEMKSLGDDSLPIDVTKDEKMDMSFSSNTMAGKGSRLCVVMGLFDENYLPFANCTLLLIIYHINYRNLSHKSSVTPWVTSVFMYEQKIALKYEW